jgi:glycine betaine/proline transport system substrate-binding protein
MRKPRRWMIVASVALFAMVASACSDVGSGDGGETGGAASGETGSAVPDNSDVTITIAVNPWLGSAANANVAKVLLEQQLGYTVELVEIDEFAQFPALSTGDLDATLEVWPSGHAKDYKKYIEGNNGVVDGGELGAVGQIGWWIPTYMLDDHPELATWEGLKGNESLFQTTESGDKGQLLDGDPSFVTFDDPIAKNLGLNLKVIYAGSEDAQLAALDTAYQDQGPFLFYFWTPHWAHAEYDLTMIQLPDVTPACEDAAANDASAYACAYPEDVLYKAFNDGLQAKAPAASAFLSAMNWSNDAQNAVTVQMQGDDKVDAEQAAQNWVDENQSTWQPWVDAGMSAS